VTRPLIVVTRAADCSPKTAAAFESLGAEVLFVPTTTIAPPEDSVELDGALSEIAAFDWVIFTSAHAVAQVTGRPGWPESWCGQAFVAAVGPATAGALRSAGVAVDLVPDRAGAAGLVAALISRGHGSVQGQRVLWPRSDIARPDLEQTLTAAGATVVAPLAYRTVTVVPENLETFRAAVEEGRVAAVCFFAPSAARGLETALGSGSLRRLGSATLVASIGSTTSVALSALGAEPDIEARESSAEGLARAVMDRLSSNRGEGS
jgi:uroporphyrinogen-III synthase